MADYISRRFIFPQAVTPSGPESISYTARVEANVLTSTL